MFSMLVFLACFPFCLVLGLACCYVVGSVFVLDLCLIALLSCLLSFRPCAGVSLLLGLPFV